MREILVICILSAMAFAGKAAAKDVTVTISRTECVPVIDGYLDEATWTAVEPITGFMQYHPVEDIAPSESTELYVTYDINNLYLGFRCFDGDAREIRATVAQREDVDNDDCVGFAFDTYNSERELFLFNVNPLGIVSDFIWHYDGYTDNSWDADVEARGNILADQYCIEIRIPFKSLRMPNRYEQEWGFYALRSIKRKGEMVVWPPRTHRIPNLAAQASLLTGIRGVNAGRNLALLPYAFSSHIENPDGEERPLDAGLDVRYGITSSLMLDVTANPDYSQIEADPDRIELTQRYAERLREKRPFFTEGTDVFASNQDLFYSRSIVDPLGGVKLTGRVGRTRIGLLSCLDDEPVTGRRSLYNHVRARADVLDESTLGFLMTNKDDSESGASNRALSADGVFRFGNAYSVKSQVTRTWTTDDTSSFGATGYSLDLARFGAASYNGLWFKDFPHEFEALSGRMEEFIGYREVGTQNDLYLRQPTHHVNEIEFHAGGKARFDHANEPKEEYLWLATEGSVDRLWALLKYFKNRENILDHDFKYSGFECEFWNTPVTQLEYYTSILWGGAPYYDSLFTGWKYRLTLSSTLKLWSPLVYNVNYSREDFYYEYGGPRSYLQNVVWNKLSLRIVPQMYLRGIYQYNDLYRSSDASLLFAYEYRPLSNLYVGTNFLDFRKVKQAGDNLEAFVKISYLWRL